MPNPPTEPVVMVIRNLTIHLSLTDTVKTYLKILLRSEDFYNEDVIVYCTGLFGPGGKILKECGITADDEIYGEDGEQPNIARRCIGKLVTVKLGMQIVVKDVL